MNSDAHDYGGRGTGNLGGINAEDTPLHGLPASGRFTLPGLSCVFMVAE